MTFEIRQGEITSLRWWCVATLEKLSSVSRQTDDF